jgi:MFS-type transporter involved in bile tolerance (Atg22 family)
MFVENSTSKSTRGDQSDPRSVNISTDEEHQINSNLQAHSLSEISINSQNIDDESPLQVHCCKRLFLCGFDSWFDDNKEVIACCVIKIPEACFLATSSIFLSTALVKMASKAAGCDLDDNNECHERIYGLKPSSMLSIFLMILGAASAILMPIVGALLDSSNYRRAVGAISALVLCVLTFIQTFVSEQNWFPMLLLNVASAITMTVNLCVALAYLPELSDDEKKRAKYNTFIQLAFNVTMVIFLVGMTITSSLLQGETIQVAIWTARISLIVTFVAQILCYGIAWTRLFGPRKANKASQIERKLESDSNRCISLTSGMHSLKRTIFEVFKQRPEVRYFLFFRTFAQPAVYALTATVLSYLNERINLSSRDLGITVMIVLVLTIPGNWLAHFSMNKYDPLSSLRICILIWSVFPLIFALAITHPNHQARLFALATIWGLLTGWKEPVDKTILCACVPSGIEAEMMGLYVFASQILSWVPPLVFTLMNENGISMKYGLSSFGGYLLLAFLCLLAMGNYKRVLAGTKSHEQDEMNIVTLQIRAVSENDLSSLHFNPAPQGAGMQRGESMMSSSSI